MTEPATPRRRLFHVYSTFAIAGPQVRFALLANHFGPRYEHLIHATDGDYGCCELLGEGVDYRRVELTFDKRRTLANAWRFRNILKHERPDLLVTNNWGSIEWALANLKPVCAQLHIEDGFNPEETDRQLPRRVLFRRHVLGRHAIVAMPSHTLFSIARDQWRLPSARLAYLPNGIDCARFERAPDPAALVGLDIAPGELVVGTVAGLREVKNLARMIRGFADAARGVAARLLIFGEGPEAAPLNELIGALGLGERVRLAGHIDDPARVMPALDIFALSSNTEQMPYSVLEAMAAGLPIAATDVGDVARMVAPENRDFVGPATDEGFADALARLVADPSARRRIGAANRVWVRENYDQARMIDAYRALFDGTSPCA